MSPLPMLQSVPVKSSLGFHTLLLFIRLTCHDAKTLLNHFFNYNYATGLLLIYEDGKHEPVTRYVNGKTEYGTKMSYRIKFKQDEDKGIKDKGIEWVIRFNSYSQDYQSYFVEVIINPKILSGIDDYITAATYDDIETAETSFNAISSEISPLLRRFSYYQLWRIDYCFNAHIEELLKAYGIEFPPEITEMVTELIRRSDIPTHYKEYMEYHGTSHRMKRKPESFYLKSNSVNINFYNKSMELEKRNQERISKNQSPISEKHFQMAKSIIRFEIQCKYAKTYRMRTDIRGNGTPRYEELWHFLSEDHCRKVIENYFYRVIRRGDWYTLKDATREVEQQNFNSQKKQRLIDALKFVSECRSLAKAKSDLESSGMTKELEIFKRTLADLDHLGINPVTIPKDWGIRFIPNLLPIYLNKSKWSME
jgi:hypothetical protein